MTTSRRLWLGLGALALVVACVAALVAWNALRDGVAAVDGAQQILQLALLLLLLGVAAGLIGGVAAGRGLVGARAALRASAELNRQTLQALPAHIAVLDDRGRIATVNQAWRDFAAANDAGGLPSVAVGSDYLEVCRRAAKIDEDAARALAGIEAVLAGRQVQFSLEYPCHAPNEQRWFLMTVVPLGRSGAVITHLNITARKQTELNARFLNRLQPILTRTADPQEMAREALRALCAHLRADLAAVGEMSADAADMTVQQELRIEGPSVFGTHHMADFLDTEARQKLAAGQGIIVSDVASDPQTARHLDRFIDLELRAFVLEPLISARGLAGILLVAAGTPRTWREDEVQLLREVAARLYPALERARAERALRETDRRKDDFLATLAHELRNPLAPIRNAVEVLKRQELQDPTTQAARAIIDRQLAHMVRLIDDLLDVSRIRRGRLELRTARVALATVLENALEASRPHIAQSGHRLEVELPAQPVYLEADPVRLAQVFINLLNNAVKYTERGGTIRLSARRDGTDVVVTVSDTGIGIAAEHLPHLFDSFSHVAPANAYSEGGLGIGLSLARSLVELHGGRIEAASEGPHRGSRFSVRLPALSEVHGLPSEAASTKDQDLHGARRRILVADDNRDIVESLSLLLGLGGNQVMTASDGREAVEIAERERPDVILLDLGMPRMDGTAACRHIRRQPWGKDVRIIALTGWGQEAVRQQTGRAGFDAHLVKPVDPVALERLLDHEPASAAAIPPPTSAAD